MDTVENIKTRRSVNYFDPSFDITDEEIEKILSLSALTPSSLNLQPWEVIAVKSCEKKKILMACALNQPKVQQASVVFIIVADTNACEKNIDAVLKSWVELGYMDVKTATFYKSLPQELYGEIGSERRKLFAVKNAAFFAMTLIYAARGLGYETHLIDGFNESAVKKEFNISHEKIVPVIIAVGKFSPTGKLLPRAWRKHVKDFSSIV